MQCGGSFLLVLASQMMLTLIFPSDRRKLTLKLASFTRIVFWRTTIDPGGTAGDGNGCGVGLAGASGSGFGGVRRRRWHWRGRLWLASVDGRR